MKPSTITPTLDDIVQPLIHILNAKYPTGGLEEYLVAELGQFGALETSPNELAIELPDDLPNHELAMKAVATLLQASGSESKWGGHGIPEQGPQQEPLRISLAKRVAWAGHYWAGGRYVVIDYLDDNFDAEAAARQVASLISRLEDPANLIELGPEERALF